MLARINISSVPNNRDNAIQAVQLIFACGWASAAIALILSVALGWKAFAAIGAGAASVEAGEAIGAVGCGVFNTAHVMRLAIKSKPSAQAHSDNARPGLSGDATPARG